MRSRVFVVHEDFSVEHLARKLFDRFLRDREPVLERFAGSDVHFAVVYYTVKDRKPAQIVSIDNMRLTVNSDGTLNYDGFSNACASLASRAFREFDNTGPKDSIASEVVVDAVEQFYEKRVRYYMPELPGPSLKNILIKLFGKGASQGCR